MARTIRYATHERANATGPTMQSRRGDSKKLDVDGYLERLAKYVPAEILAGFTPLAALTAGDKGQLAFVSLWVFNTSHRAVGLSFVNNVFGHHT